VRRHFRSSGSSEEVTRRQRERATCHVRAEHTVLTPANVNARLAANPGDPVHFEAFDPLRGIANSAPYFHDNSAETLRDLVDIYSRFIVQFFPMLNLPLLNPAEFEGGPPESFTPQQKQDLIEL
jgi:hypothetical protein